MPCLNLSVACHAPRGPSLPGAVEGGAGPGNSKAGGGLRQGDPRPADPPSQGAHQPSLPAHKEGWHGPGILVVEVGEHREAIKVTANGSGGCFLREGKAAFSTVQKIRGHQHFFRHFSPFFTRCH